MNGNIFKKRENILPYEYPELLDYKDAIRHSYWIDTEFNFLTYTGRILQVILSKSLENPVEFNDVEKYFHIMTVIK